MVVTPAARNEITFPYFGFHASLEGSGFSWWRVKNRSKSAGVPLAHRTLGTGHDVEEPGTGAR